MTGDRSGRPWVAAGADELLAGATDRQAVAADDGKSGSRFERVTIDGERYFAKSLSYATDWIMRVTGDRDHRPLLIWQTGLMDEAPPCIDHTVVGMAIDGQGESAVLTVLMRDVGSSLVPEGDTVVPPQQHASFIEHLAALSAAFWGWRDPIGLTSLEERLRFFAPDNIAPELRMDEVPVPLRMADEGWRILRERAPRVDRVVRALHDDPSPLVDAMRATPSTFLHGDWKMGNLGSHPDGRTILIDWAYPGEGPACLDLAWYLALNRARIPESKEATIERFRLALDRESLDPDAWFDEQVALCLLGMTVIMGWEKALGDEDELRWWERHALAGAARL